MIRFHRRTFVAGAVASVLWPAGLVGAAEPSPPAPLAVPAKPARMPGFELAGVNLPQLRAGDLRDKPLLIRFWASW